MATEISTPTAAGATTDAAAASASASASAPTLIGTTCMELALEGERLCKAGDFRNGVRFFEEAIKVGTNDDRTLSAIYSQLGNAYFYMEDYQKALEYHKQDVTLVHSIGDEIAEAKACGNLGNTFKMLSKFDEAAVYCRRYLEISRKLKDEVGEGRALYNLGNVYHTQGKRIIGSSDQEPGELSNDIKSSLQRAIEYYTMNLEVVTKLKDYASMGRAYGNLGNTHYLLGNFEMAVESHKKRLELARKTNDKSAERRAHLNLGNANVFLGNFPEAVENYMATLKIAQELQDRYTEAHSCYSLANTYTFLRDYKSAVCFHLKYLEMIKEFDDKLGEGRACWSLVNIYQMVNDPESALIYAKRHSEIAELLGDKAGLASAKLNIQELEEIISQKQVAKIACSNANQQPDASNSSSAANKKYTSESMNVFRLSSDKRQEQEQRRFKKQLNSNLAVDIDGLVARRKGRSERGTVRSSSSERLFDMIAHFQSGRIDDQRCEIFKRTGLNTDAKTRITDNKENFATGDVESSGNNVNGASSRASQPSTVTNPISAAASAIKATYRKASLAAYPASSGTPSFQPQRRPTVSAEHREQLFDMIAGAQGQRMDEQRASLPALTLANGILKNPTNAGLLSRGQTLDQSSTIRSIHQHDATSRAILGIDSKDCLPSEANRTTATPSTTRPMNPPTMAPKHHKLTRHFHTIDSEAQVHDDKFLDSLMKYQSTRFNDQRSDLPNKPKIESQLDKDKGQADNFFNLIVRFQSGRLDDQRSTPPARNKNM